MALPLITFWPKPAPRPSLPTMLTWAQLLYNFYTSLRPEPRLPGGVRWLYPQQNADVLQTVQLFLNQYFADSNQRTLLLGINPGRFGAGVTGINFTAARQLTEVCGIPHPFGKGSELSAEFIYAMIEAYGGASSFYSRFFIGSVCPLGFVKEGKNINYYDDKALQIAVEPFIVSSINTQLSFPVNRAVCYCIGGEKNYKALSALNGHHQWFQRIVPLPHPRFIMQYRRRFVSGYIQEYLAALATA